MRPRTRSNRIRLLLASALATATPAFAQTVTSTAASGPGTLRAALDAAAPDAQIGFQLGSGTSPTILLPSGAAPLVVGVDGVRIDGTGATGLALSGTQTLPADPLPVILRLDAGGAEDDVEITDIQMSTGVVELDGTLSYRTNRDTTLSVDIRDLAGGEGALVKGGSATLFLLGDNSFGGDLSVVQGTVRGPASGFPGDIATGASVVFDQPIDDAMNPTPGLYSGRISDYQPATGNAVAGQVTKTGAGELRWSGGAHTYSGGTRIEQGLLVLSPGTRLPSSGAIAILGPATLAIEMDATRVTNLNGALTGAGNIELDGADSTSILNLGAGNFSGNFLFSGGAARVLDAANVLRGDVDFATSAGTLEILSNATLGGNLSGTGTLRVDPAAGQGTTVTLSGSNSHTQTQVVSGTLVGSSRSLVGSIDNASALSVSASGSTPFTAAVSGAGSFTKVSGGSLALSVDQDYTGPTTVSAGALDLRADLNGSSVLSVASGATLAGFGDAPAAALTVSGALAPSSLSDPISVSSASFASGSSLRLDVRDDGSADRLVAAGDIDAGSADLELLIAMGDYSGGVTATLLESTGGTVTAPALTQSFPFLSVVPDPVPGMFRVTITGNLGNVATLARTPNQRAIATYLQPQLDAVAGPPADEPFDSVRGRFFALPSEAAVRRAFDSLGGEAHSALASANLSATQRLDRTLHRRSRGVSFGSGQALWGSGKQSGLALAPARLPRAARGFAKGLEEGWRPAPRPNLWFDLWGGLGSLDGGSASDVDQALAGVFLGGDAPLGPVQLGAALGYSFADLELDSARTDTRSQAIHAALYASTSSPLGYLSVAGRYVHAFNASERRIALPGGSDSADADFDTSGGGVGFEGGLNLLSWGAALLQGVVSLDWTRLQQASFDESGAGPLNLEVASERTDSLRTGLGLHLNGRIEMDGGVHLLPELRLRWLHELGDTRRQVSARFVDAPVAGGFTLSGADAPRDALLAGLGWTGEVSSALRIHADYDALVDARRIDHRLSVGAQLSF